MLAVLAATLVAAASPAAASPRQATLFEAPREMLSDDAALRAQTLDEVSGFGVQWMRVVLFWRAVSPQHNSWRRPQADLTAPSTYDWSRYDRAIDEIRARGIRVLVTLSGPIPDWASRSRHSARLHPSAALFARFAYAAALHYGDRVNAWAIWNEPNHPDFLGPQHSRGHATSPHIYRNLFRAGERGIHKAAGNRRDTVLIGETAPVGTSRVVAPLTFLRGVLCLNRHWHKRRGCSRLNADGWAHHAYTHGAPWYVPHSRNDVTIGVLHRLNRALARAGRAGALPRGIPIWLTEFGIQSKPDPFIGVSELKQSEFRAIAEHMAYRNRRVRIFSQYLMRDDDPKKGPRRQRYSGFETGLRYANGRRKRAYGGFRLPLVATRGHRRVRLWGIARPAHGRTRVTIQYRGRHGRRWHRLKSDRTNRRGVFSTTTRYVRGRRYRLAWHGHRGSLTRVYRRG